MVYRFVSFLFLLIFILFYSPSIGMAEVHSGSNWTLEVPAGDSSYVQSIRDFLDISDDAYGTFFKGLGLNREKNRSIKVQVLPDFESFKNFQKKHSSSKSNSAFYSLFESKVYTWKVEKGSEILSNVMHEATHHFIREYTERDLFPRCLDEGFAEIFENGQVAGGRIILDRTEPSWSDLLKKAQKSNEIKSIDFFLEMHPRPFVQYKHAKFKKLNIAHCWGITRFLYFSKRGDYHPILKALILQSGQQKSAKDIITENLPGDMTFEDLNTAWYQYVQQF